MSHKILNDGPWKSLEADLLLLGDVTGRKGQSARLNSIERKGTKLSERKSNQFLVFKRLKEMLSAKNLSDWTVFRSGRFGGFFALKDFGA